MELKEKQLFIFDLDGTIVDAYDAIHQSINETLAAFGQPVVDYATAKSSVGEGDRRFIERFFPPNLVDRALSRYREAHRKALRAYSRPTAFAIELLTSLKKHKYLTAVATNRPKEFTNIILESLSMGSLLDCVVCPEDAGAHKPKPRAINMILDAMSIEKGKAVFIGDMDIDFETAKNGGMDFVFVKGGSTDIETLYQKAPDLFVVENLGEIISLLFDPEAQAFYK